MRPRRRVQRRTLHLSILDRFEQQRDAVATLEQGRNRAPARVRAVAAPVVENDLSRGRLVECGQRIDGGGFELRVRVGLRELSPERARPNRNARRAARESPGSVWPRGRSVETRVLRGAPHQRRQARSAGKLPMRPAAPRHCRKIAAARMPAPRRATCRFRASTSRSPRVSRPALFRVAGFGQSARTSARAPPGSAARRSAPRLDQQLRVRPDSPFASTR